MQLKEAMTLNQRGNRSIFEYLQSIKATTDELALIDMPLFNDDLTLHVLNGLGLDYHDIVAPIRAKEFSFNFEELHDLCIDHGLDLKR